VATLHVTFAIRALLLPALIEKARQASSMQGNPIELTENELVEILQRAR